MTATIFAHKMTDSAGDLDSELQNLFDWIEEDEEDGPLILSHAITVCCPF